jgi:uncharacterized protein (UPF0332 family)
MLNNKPKQDRLRLKLAQARAALEEAGALLDEGAELPFVINGLYYAFLYPILGMLQARSIAAPMQSSAIDLFEREFVMRGEIDRRFLEAARRASELRPSCDCEHRKKITRADIDQLLPAAREFLDLIERMTE